MSGVAGGLEMLAVSDVTAEEEGCDEFADHGMFLKGRPRWGLCNSIVACEKWRYEKCCRLENSLSTYTGADKMLLIYL